MSAAATVLPPPSAEPTRRDRERALSALTLEIEGIAWKYRTFPEAAQAIEGFLRSLDARTAALRPPRPAPAPPSPPPRKLVLHTPAVAIHTRRHCVGCARMFTPSDPAAKRCDDCGPGTRWRPPG